MLKSPKEIKIDAVDYNLPNERIAENPLPERDSSKLLIYKNFTITEDVFKNIDQSIPNGSLLVFNKSRVINARLFFETKNGAKIEIFCLEPSEKNNWQWHCFVGNSKRWKEGEVLELGFNYLSQKHSLFAKKIENRNDYFVIQFSSDDKQINFYEILNIIGKIPLPPYIKRQVEENDKERYQTIYSENLGSVAAPTAGLHFSEDVLKKLGAKNINIQNVILHVGAGTFLPVKSEKMEDHSMHSEKISVSLDLIENLIESIPTKKIIMVGTTSMRTIESLYWIGLKLKLKTFEKENPILVNQWEPYELNDEISEIDSLIEIKNYLQENNLEKLEGQTKIIIAPGYKIKFTNAIITNFHQPKSTLLLLISALVGENWKKIYSYALENNFRFLSFGDSSILWKH